MRTLPRHASPACLHEGHEVLVRVPVVAAPAPVVDVPPGHEEVVHGRVDRFRAKVRLDADHIDADALPVDGLQHLQLRALHVQDPQVHVRL